MLEVLKDGESYTVEDNINGNPGAYTFTVSDPALDGEASSGIKSVTINGEPQAGPTPIVSPRRMAATMTRERNIPWLRLTTRETRLRPQSEPTGGTM